MSSIEQGQIGKLISNLSHHKSSGDKPMLNLKQYNRRWNIVLEPTASEDLSYWEATNTKIHTKITSLMEAIAKSPFSGIGKPEPLKHDWAGYWSRRISKEHRLIYKVMNDLIFVSTCRYHYS
jgi:toxin YoeB